MKQLLKKLKKYLKITISNKEFKDLYKQNKQEIINNLKIKKCQTKEKGF